jgi:hypothetical protein
MMVLVEGLGITRYEGGSGLVLPCMQRAFLSPTQLDAALCGNLSLTLSVSSLSHTHTHSLSLSLSLLVFPSGLLPIL